SFFVFILTGLFFYDTGLLFSPDRCDFLRKAYLDGRSFPFLRVDLYSILRTVIQPDTLRNRSKAEARPLAALDGPPDLPQTFLCHALTVVRHTEDQSVPVVGPFYHNTSASALILDAVIEGVLRQRLKSQLRHHDLIEFVRNTDLEFQDIPVS